MAQTIFKPSRNWYFDSGCSRRMTGFNNYLVNIEPYQTNSITFGDGATREIKGIGNIVCRGLPELNNVFLVEGLAANLISINQLCDQGLKVTFTKTSCLVTDEDNNVLMRGERSSDKCYMWKPEERKECCEACYFRRRSWKEESVMSSQNSPRTYEAHLSHLKNIYDKSTDERRYTHVLNKSHSDLYKR